MPIYDKPARELMHEFARQLQAGEPFDKSRVIGWFRDNYPRLKSNTVSLHVEGMSTNSRSRLHHPGIRPDAGWDLFYKLGPSRFRLWNSKTDPAPIYKDDILSGRASQSTLADPESEEIGEDLEPSSEFAVEADLQRYLARNLHVLEPGLRLYEDNESGFKGVEFPAGQRSIDILCVGSDNAFVVVELKVSRGHERVVGQILRYMGWVRENLDSQRPVRGIIVASQITEDIRLAVSLIPNIRLYEYQISFSVRPINEPETDPRATAAR